MDIKAIIDPHMHVWDTALYPYPWLTGEPQLPQQYGLSDYLNDTKPYPIVKAVHIQAGIAREHSLSETAWISSLAEEHAFPMAIVGYVDLTKLDCEHQLEAHAAYPGFIGIRQMMDEADHLQDPVWQDNLHLLAKHQLCFDLQIHFTQSKAAYQTIAAHECTFVIEHTLMPERYDASCRSDWVQHLKRLSQCKNAHLKISGFGLNDTEWTQEAVRPFVHTALDIFGTNRCLFASNFPVEKPVTSFSDLYQRYFSLTDICTSQERDEIFHHNANRIYWSKQHG